MTTFYTIEKTELDFDTEIKSQLFSLAQQIEDNENEYNLLPQEEFLDTFVWVLENNHIPYRLSKPNVI